MNVRTGKLGRDADIRDFVKLFQTVARYRHRHEVFRDFILMTACSLHNRIKMDDSLEQEYLETIHRYKKEDRDEFPKLIGLLIAALDYEPYDVLGKIYMDLEISNKYQGQFFTPPEISRLMTELNLSGLDKALEEKPFLRFSEPACGSGGMILAVASRFLEKGYDPARCMWAECVDVDRTAALMCYIQLALWNVPAKVVVGNSLSLEVRELWFTPAHYLGGWQSRLQEHSPCGPSS